MRFLLVAVALCSSLYGREMKGFLTNQEIELFYQQGYIVKKQGLTEDEIKKADASVETLIDRSLTEIKQSADQLLSEKDQMLFIDGSRVVFKRNLDQSISLVRINGVSGIEPSLLDIVRSEKMVHTFFELLNTNEIEHLISQMHPKLSGDGVAYPKHRDIQFRKSFDPNWTDVLGNGSYAICIIPVDPMTEENGGLWIDRNNYPESQNLEEDRIWINAEPGDLFFMHPHLFHGSGSNTSKASRRTLLTGFCAYGANHMIYPGADVNVRLTLKDDSTILTQNTFWDQSSKVESNH